MPPCERMYSSAIRSSSAGRDARLERARRRARASRRRRAPARAICSISWADLRMIMRRRPTCRALPGSRVDLVDRPVGVERDELAGRAVVLDDRLGLRVVDARAGARSTSGVSSSRPSSARAAEQRAPWRPRRRDRRRRSRRARGRSRRASRRAPRPGPGCAGSRRGRTRRGRRPRRAARGSARSSARPGRGRRAAMIGSTSRPSRRRVDRGAEHVAGRDVRDARTRPRSASPAFPCPTPAGRARARSLLQEALVGAHHHLRLHLAHRVERDADDDQHRGAAERAARSPARSRRSG